jgi:hypothetical protein
MKVVTTALRELMALGVTGDALLQAIARIEEAAAEQHATSVRDAVEAASVKADRELAERKAKAAARTRKSRAKKDGDATSGAVTSPSVTVTPPDATERDPEPSRTGARVVNLTSSLRSEGTSEAKASSVNASSAASKPADPEKPKTKPPKAARGSRLPEDWEPSAEEFDLGRDAGLTDEEIHRAALEFRNYWCSRSRDAAKLSWRLTWHNRVNELGDRKRRVGPRLVAASGQPGGGGRGSSTFADIYARRHGKGAD